MQKTQVSALLSIEQTSHFIRDIKGACLNLSFQDVQKVINNFDLMKCADTDDFLFQAKSIFKEFEAKSNVRNVDFHDSKCIACSFGKTVMVYEVFYTKSENAILSDRIIYKKSFAINIEIIDGQLLDFAWCNAFLSKEEIKKLKNYE